MELLHLQCNAPFRTAMPFRTATHHLHAFSDGASAMICPLRPSASSALQQGRGAHHFDQMANDN
jgi:hypothetical protein